MKTKPETPQTAAPIAKRASAQNDLEPVFALGFVIAARLKAKYPELYAHHEQLVAANKEGLESS